MLTEPSGVKKPRYPGRVKAPGIAVHPIACELGIQHGGHFQHRAPLGEELRPGKAVNLLRPFIPVDPVRLRAQQIGHGSAIGKGQANFDGIAAPAEARRLHIQHNGPGAPCALTIPVFHGVCLFILPAL